MRKLFQYFLIVILISNCSSDGTDNSTDNGTNNSMPNISALAVKNNETYQLNVSQNGNQVDEINLSTTLGLPEYISKVDVTDKLVTFYHKIGNNVDVYQKNLQTNETFTSESICKEDDESILAVFNSKNKFIALSIKYLANNDAENCAKILDKNTGICNSIYLSNGYFSSFYGICMNENAYITLSENNIGTLYNIDLDNNLIETELEIDPYYFATAVNNKLYFFYNGQILTLDPNTLETTSTSTFGQYIYPTNLSVNNSRWFKTQLIGNEMLVYLTYPQPSQFSHGPATLDITTGEYIEANTFLFNVVQNFNEAHTTGIGIYCYETDLQSRIVYCGYQNNDGSGTGGIIKTNFNGEILGFVELDYVPYRLIL